MIKNYHFIGIGGVGMSGMAHILLNKKMRVSGSDIAANAITDSLQKEGALISIGHDAKHIMPDMTVIYSTDIKKDNPEFLAAKSLQCPMLHRSELLQKLMQSSKSLAVAGTHGKTTTSSLLAWVLEHSGLSPSYAIGGIAPQLKTNAQQGRGDYFIAEACESDGTFLNYTPYGAIITNIDTDHIDFYGNQANLTEAFKKFTDKVESVEHLFWCGDDPHLKQMKPPGISYGFGADCLLRASHFKQQGWLLQYDISYRGKRYSQIEVPLAGAHNVLNTLAVFGMALAIGIREDLIRSSLRTFGGVLRRCEKKGEDHGIVFLDDYAHHPNEIRATLKGIREAMGERRLVIAYQPHRYSRAKTLLGAYQEVFEEADHLFLTGIYAANEAPIPGITDEVVVRDIINHSKLPCHFVKRLDLASSLAAFLRPHDVCITLGAGDITKLAGEVLAQIKLKAPKKLKVGVIMGGRSVEHEVSLMSAEHILNSLHPDLYEVEQFGITREGAWIVGPKTRSQLLLNLKEPLQIPSKISPEVLKALLNCDILFPILHGSYGEDGTIQGFFEMLGVAYVGCDHRSAAVSMDKVLTKRLLIDANIPTSPFVSFSRYSWNNDQNIIKKRILDQLKFPVFVKPTHLGSSIGVHKVNDEASLDDAINDAFRFDTDVLVENGIAGREIEFSVLGNDQITAYPPGEILTNGELYDYVGKYSKNGTKTTAQALLTPQLISEGIDLVKKAFKAVGCNGMARVDTFLDQQGKFWLNEINPIPGFTQNSLFPQMCAVNGLQNFDLIDRLIILGLQRKRTHDLLEAEP